MGVNPLSGNSKGASYSQRRIDTLLGAGVRIDGNIIFTGVLRTQAEVLGDISCAADPNGTVVVGKSGHVTGTISAAHLVVGGHVCGPVHSSESLEIQEGASIVGDVSYRNIVVHAGGVIEGTLTPRVPRDRDHSGQEHSIPDQAPPAAKEDEIPLADAMADVHGPGQPTGSWRKFGVGFAVLLAVVAVVLVSRNWTAVTAPVAAEPLAASSSTTVEAATPSAPAQSAAVREGAGAAVAEAVPEAPRADAEVERIPLAPQPVVPGIDSEQVTTVQGESAGKSAGFLFVTGNEPCVLVKKKRRDPGEGTRIDVAQGAKKRIAIARDEILRVAAGRDIDIFYQGRKVAASTIESGIWMSFVPYSDNRD